MITNDARVQLDLLLTAAESDRSAFAAIGDLLEENGYPLIANRVRKMGRERRTIISHVAAVLYPNSRHHRMMKPVTKVINKALDGHWDRVDPTQHDGIRKGVALALRSLVLQLRYWVDDPDAVEKRLSTWLKI